MKTQVRAVNLVIKFGNTQQAFYDHSRHRLDEERQEALIIDLLKSVRSSLPDAGRLKRLHIRKDYLAAHHITIGVFSAMRNLITEFYMDNCA